MNSRFSKRAALAVLAVALLCAPFLFHHPFTESERSTQESAPPSVVPEASATIAAEIAAVPPQQIPPLPKPTPASVSAPAVRKAEPAPQDPSFAPGHFPGVSVRHVPGTHVPTPPEGTERTIPEAQEVVLPDGRVLIGVTLDETWRVPVKLKTDR